MCCWSGHVGGGPCHTVGRSTCHTGDPDSIQTMYQCRFVVYGSSAVCLLAVIVVSPSIHLWNKDNRIHLKIMHYNEMGHFKYKGQHRSISILFSCYQHSNILPREITLLLNAQSEFLSNPLSHLLPSPFSSLPPSTIIFHIPTCPLSATARQCSAPTATCTIRLPLRLSIT